KTKILIAGEKQRLQDDVDATTAKARRLRKRLSRLERERDQQAAAMGESEEVRRLDAAIAKVRASLDGSHVSHRPVEHLSSSMRALGLLGTSSAFYPTAPKLTSSPMLPSGPITSVEPAQPINPAETKPEDESEAEGRR